MPPGPTRFGPRRICIHAETFLSINIRTNPRMANNPIIQIAMIRNSSSIAVVGLNVSYNQVSIECDMFSKLHIFILKFWNWGISKFQFPNSQLHFLPSYLSISGITKSNVPIIAIRSPIFPPLATVSYTHLRAHETPEHLVCRLLLEK